MHPGTTRDLALKLRRDGYSYPYISKKTGLSKSTLSGWLTDVSYSPNQETIDSFGKARAASTKQKAAARQKSIAIIRTQAAGEIGKLSA